MTRMEIITAALLVAVLLLGGCAGDQVPAFVTTEHPTIPAECNAASIKVEVPKLPGAGKREVYEDEAARDRNALTAALTHEKLQRLSCAQQLRELFPQQQPKQKKG